LARIAGNSMLSPDFSKRDDIVDAEFISISPAAAPRAPVPTVATPLVRLQGVVPAVDGMAMLSRDVVQTGGAPTQAGPVFWGGGALIALAAFWVAGGHALFAGAVVPSAANPTGLRIASVVSRVDRSGIRPVLQVDGKAVNDGSRALSLPPLQIQVVSAAGGSTLYKLGTGGQSLGGGDSFDFSSRLDLPKDGVQTVFVTFAQ
jgi:hypothetical protein